MNREEKKAAKRAEIIKKSLKLFEKQGYEATTTAEIAAACNIAKKTLFQYFPTKSDIVFENEGELLAELLTLPADWPAIKAHLARFDGDSGNPLPSLILNTPELTLRLLQMWRTYETQIAEHFGSDLVAEVLAARVVLALRLCFENRRAMKDVIEVV
ncbi:MAG: TetR/AcrR family transcriptional regulator [Streptococcaceae bacterium]|jgi:AcrR family transcriptional regulator|nr:TetR/AcrR family transcriptional regulator [Streptococcaceae bacterium]